MRIGIFNEPRGIALGGTEFCTATLAEALSAEHEIVILHRKEEFALERLENFYGSRLPSVSVHSAPVCPREYAFKPPRWRDSLLDYGYDRKWTSDYDVFVTFTHRIPPICFARRGILIVLFPVGQRPAASTGASVSLLQRASEALTHWCWKRRMKSYRFAFAISEYAREWTKRYWGIECEILHPPCRMVPNSAPKQEIILSVGRFTPLKRQISLMKAYRLLEPQVPQCWKYRSVGPLAPEDSTYYREVAALAESTRAELCTDLPREILDGEFRRAAIFWHGAGESGSEECPPVMAEHFGITTVEAMSARCVPVVNRKGGQSEIVEHGISGFLWETIEELLHYTKELMADSVLRARMADAASRRAKSFSQEAFVSRFKEILAPSIR